MGPITLIVAALGSGSEKDAYASLKALVARRLGGGLVLARHKASSGGWRTPLAAELADADSDLDLVRATPALIVLVDTGGAGKYAVDVRGVQVGDHARQNVFHAPPGGLAPLDTGRGGSCEH